MISLDESIDVIYKKSLRRRIKDYHWNDIQSEINSFFNAIQRVNIPDSSTYCLQKFSLKQKEILNKFDLDEKKIMDILYLDRIYEMLKYIKEVNFCFPNNWDTSYYNHHEHGYKLKDLIEAIKGVAEEITQFKADKHDLLKDKKENFQIQDKFIDLDFKDSGLSYYDKYVRLINGIADHPDFYMVLPHLLRTLFENLLHDIFSQSLHTSDTDLYYNKRFYDFARLITLLDIVKDAEFGPYISNKITKETIKELNNIREKGNISIHDIEEKITPSYAREIMDTIRITLNPLLISYKKLYGKNINVDRERKYSIKVKLGIIKEVKKAKKKKKRKKEKRQKTVEHLEDISEVSALMSDIRLLLNEETPESVIKIRTKMDELLLRVKPYINKNQREALGKAYAFFNYTLETAAPLKKTLQALFDVVNIIILGR